MNHQNPKGFSVGKRTAIVLLLLIALSGCTRDNRARVIIDNQSTCGTITTTLTNEQTKEIKHVDTAVGQRVEIEVTPDVYYDYLIDYTTAGRTANGLNCTDVESGKLKVPAGTAQTFQLKSATPTP